MKRMESRLITMAEAARRIGVTPNAITIAIRKGTLKSEKHGPYILIDTADVEMYKWRSQHDPDMSHRNPKYREYPGGKAEKRRMAKHETDRGPSE